MAIPRETKDAAEAQPVAGEQDFVITASKEEEYSSGNSGLTVTLRADNGCVATECNPFVSGWMLVRLRHLCESISLPMDPPPEARAFVGRRGRGLFKVETYQGRDRLKVVDYVPRKDTPTSATSQTKPDDVPF